MSPSFCRHNRFVDRCPICRESVPGQGSTRRAAKPKRRTSTASAGQADAGGRSANGRGQTGRSSPARGAATRGNQQVRVHRELRAQDDGYRCELVPGLHASEDARRLARELGFASGRLLALEATPPSFYAEARKCGDLEQATWACFLAAYLSPSQRGVSSQEGASLQRGVSLQGDESLQDDGSFAGIREALLRADWASDAVPDLEGVVPGPRTSHDPARGSATLTAYRRFAEQAGSQQRAFAGEPEWTPQRRFARLFERLALPGFGRMGRYDLLVTLGRLGLYELRADSLQLVTRSAQASDRTPPAAKRVFGIGDPIIIERRAQALAEAVATPVEALDLALYNWSLADPGQERVTLGFPPETCDTGALQRAEAALGV